jgi:3-hydroxyisobutyrate dehydrogenase-like beta-hydroxyacid dehydrogenase
MNVGFSGLGRVDLGMASHGVSAINQEGEHDKSVAQALITCPALGRPDLATEGLLSSVADGPRDAVDTLRTLLEPMGKEQAGGWDCETEVPIIELGHVELKKIRDIYLWLSLAPNNESSP